MFRLGFLQITYFVGNPNPIPRILASTAYQSMLYAIVKQRSRISTRTSLLRAACKLSFKFRLGLIAITAAVTLVARTEDRSLMHFRVMWMHDPAEKAVVSWTTPTAGEKHTVYYDTESRQARLDDYSHKEDASHNGRFTTVDDDEGTPEGFYHHALLEDLQPATKYYLTMVSDGHSSREYHFITAPDDDREIKLLFGGDSRRPPSLPEPHLDRKAMNKRIASLVEEHPGIIALAHGGDYCSRAEWRFMRDWLSDHELTITEAGRILPIIPARGNHDRAIVFEEMFYWPDRDHDYYYATELSKRAVLLTLNTEISHAGDQREWLEEELKRQRENPGKWILAQYHVPAYGSVKSYQQGESQRLHWVPLFEEYQVDLVCEADHHSLKRTVPIYQDQRDDERGIVYIGDGGLGVPQRTPDATRWYLQEPGMTASVHNVHFLELQHDELRGRAIGIEGEVLDEFTITPKAVAAGR